MNVLFLQTAHRADDDRVYYHQRVSLEAAGLSCAFAGTVDEIKAVPEVVICDTPKAVWDARKAAPKAAIVYDITEWYPSKKNLRNIATWLRPLKWCILAVANLYAGCASDAFIFGEYYKAKPFRFLFPRKRHLYLPYYPSLHYIRPTAPRDLSSEIRLFYAGPKTAEKGYNRIVEVTRLCQELMPDRHFKLTAVNGISFEDFCDELSKQDIFLDLRDNDIENTHCLPIKLFYYMAAGRPVIYSDLKAIRQGVPEISDESLVRPDQPELAARKICQYAEQPDLYRQVCNENLSLSRTKYNWEVHSKAFIHFINHL